MNRLDLFLPLASTFCSLWKAPMLWERLLLWKDLLLWDTHHCGSSFPVESRLLWESPIPVRSPVTLRSPTSVGSHVAARSPSTVESFLTVGIPNFVRSPAMVGSPVHRISAHDAFRYIAIPLWPSTRLDTVLPLVPMPSSDVCGCSHVRGCAGNKLWWRGRQEPGDQAQAASN